MLAESEARYLMLIYRVLEEEKQTIGTNSLASLMGVQPPTVNEVLKKLAKKGMLRYEPYAGFGLTPLGKRKARELLRKHRIVETFLHRFLGYSTKLACRSASRLDFHLPAKLVGDLCQKLDHPKVCPCGKPIARGRECERS